MAKMVTQEEAIEKLKVVHGDTYDFSESIYNGASSRLTAKCKVHGYFTMRFSDLKSGSGCWDCGNERKNLKNSTPYSEFLALSLSVHGDKYDYSLSESSYKAVSRKVDIICKTHGLFKQTGNDHTSGNGCPKCQVNGFNRSRNGCLYLLSNGMYCKIGVTNRDVLKRVKEINKTLESSTAPFRVVSHFIADGQFVYDAEQDILQQFKNYGAHGVSFSGATETFYSDCFGSLLSSFVAYKSLAPSLGVVTKRKKRKSMKSLEEITAFRRDKVLAQTGVPVGVVVNQGKWVFQETRRNPEGVKYKKILGRFEDKLDAISFALHYYDTGEVLDTRKNLLVYNESGWLRGVQTHGGGGYQASAMFTRPTGERVKIYLGHSKDVSTVESLRRKFNEDLESGLYGEYFKSKYD